MMTPEIRRLINAAKAVANAPFDYRLTELLQAAEAVEKLPDTVKHVARGSTYDLSFVIEMQCSDRALGQYVEGRRVQVYIAHKDGKAWGRFVTEFNDGRFTVPAPGESFSTELGLLRDLAHVLDAHMEEGQITPPGRELVSVALGRVFPGNLHTVESCSETACRETGCEECPTRADLLKADGKLRAWLAANAGPAISVGDVRGRGIPPKILEAVDTPCSIGPEGCDFALTLEWADGTETLEHVSEHAARFLGYDPVDAGVAEGDRATDAELRELFSMEVDEELVCDASGGISTCAGAWHRDGAGWVFRTGEGPALKSYPALIDGLNLDVLQAANAARQAEWCPDQLPDLSFRGNELAGEAGEASEALVLHAAELGRLAGRTSNLIKKLERERYGWRGSRATLADLSHELGDVVICASLCSITAGIKLSTATINAFNSTSEKQGLTTRLPLLIQA